MADQTLGSPSRGFPDLIPNSERQLTELLRKPPGTPYLHPAHHIVYFTSARYALTYRVPQLDRHSCRCQILKAKTNFDQPVLQLSILDGKWRHGKGAFYSRRRPRNPSPTTRELVSYDSSSLSCIVLRFGSLRTVPVTLGVLVSSVSD